MGEEMNKNMPQHFLPANFLISNHRSRTRKKEKFLPKCKEGEKKRYIDAVDKDRIEPKSQVRTRRRFENTAIHSCNLAGKSSRSVSTTECVPKKESPNKEDNKSIRNTRSNYGSYRHFSQATKRKIKENKRIRRENVSGALASILGPDDEYDSCELTFESDRATKSASATKSVVVVPLVSERGQNPITSTMKSVSTDRETEMDRIDSIIGSIVTMFGPKDGSLVESSKIADSSAAATVLGAATDDIANSPRNRNKPTTLTIVQASKRRNDVKNNRKQKVAESFRSIPGPEQESTSASDQGVYSAPRTKSTEMIFNSTAQCKSSLITKQNQIYNHGSIAISMKPNSRKEAQQMIDNKYGNAQNDMSHFKEDEARGLIRARLRKNQKKYAALAVALASSKPNLSSGLVIPPVPDTTTTPESIRAAIESTEVKSGESEYTPSTTTTIRQQPKLRSRARNGRLYLVCKRIPPSIPENSVFLLEMHVPQGTPNLASKAVFHPRPTIPKSELARPDSPISTTNNGKANRVPTQQMKALLRRRELGNFNVWLANQ